MKRFPGLILFFFLLWAAEPYAQRSFWGTVMNGGQYGQGYLYRTDSTGDNFVIVHHFDGTNGGRPGLLCAGSDGNIYGVTARGGQGVLSPSHKGGVLFCYDLAIDSLKILFHFSENNAGFPYDGPDAYAGLTESAPGVFYGQVISGGLQQGHIFRFDVATGSCVPAVDIPAFQGGGLNTTLGNRLAGPLYKAADGFLYATTEANSQCPVPQPDRGSIVRIDPAVNSYTVLYLNPCSAAEGYQYSSPFVPYGGGLYSTSLLGGNSDNGVIYRYSPATGIYTKMYDFTGGAGGTNPSPMVPAANGKFYGVAAAGSPQPNLPGGGGILFEYDPAGNSFSKKLDFLLGNGAYTNVGIDPVHLIPGSNGKLYGTARNGVYEYDTQLNQTRAAGRYPIGMGWPVPERPSLLEVCRRPSYVYQASAYTLCPGAAFSHDLQASGAVQVVWKHNGVTAPSQTSSLLSFPALSAADTGTWTAELYNACGVTHTQVVRVALEDTSVYIVREDIELQAIYEQGTLQWINCADHMPVPGATGPVFIPGHNGSYAVILVTPAGCSDTSACFLVDFVGLEEPGPIPLLHFYPNPATDILVLEMQDAPEAVYIYNTSGVRVRESKSVQTDVSDLRPGLYLLEVRAGGRVYHARFIRAGK